MVRKAALVIHIVSSVGWMGTVAAFLVLALVGLLNTDPAMAKAAYRVMAPVAWFMGGGFGPIRIEA